MIAQCSRHNDSVYDTTIIIAAMVQAAYSMSRDDMVPDELVKNYHLIWREKLTSTK